MLPSHGPSKGSGWVAGMVIHGLSPLQFMGVHPASPAVTETARLFFTRAKFASFQSQRLQATLNKH